MLKVYKEYQELLINNQHYFTALCFWHGKILLEESEIAERIINYTWADFLERDILFGSGGVEVYWYKSFKKKRLMIKNIRTSYEIHKQEKEPDLKISIRKYYEECDCSIKEILDMKDTERAIRYLVERGMTAVQELR